MIKLIALDLDDTLLMPDCTIPESVIAVLHRAAGADVRFVIATGRIFPSARMYAQEISSDCPIICYNGSMIATADGNVIYSRMLDTNVMHEMAVFCREHGLYLQLYSEDRIVIERDCREFRIDPDSRITGFDEVGDLTKAVLKPSPKMMILDTPEHLEQLRPELETRFGEVLHFTTSKDFLLEMLPKGVTKSRTLSILCRKFGITQSEVMACGDNTNDMEMIRWAGVGVAVANAVPELKAAAEYTSRYERSYGVAEAVEKYILSNR